MNHRACFGIADILLNCAKCVVHALLSEKNSELLVLFLLGFGVLWKGLNRSEIADLKFDDLHQRNTI